MGGVQDLGMGHVSREILLPPPLPSPLSQADTQAGGFF